MDAWTIVATLVAVQLLGSALALAIVSINRSEPDVVPLRAGPRRAPSRHAYRHRAARVRRARAL